MKPTRLAVPLAGVLLATGTSFAILIPLAACVMMGAMGMFAKRHGGH